jgi:hypothetical protein
MSDKLLFLLESVLGKSKKTSGTNYAFYSPFIEHQKPKLEIDLDTTNDGKNKWHCWVSDTSGLTIKSLFKKIGVTKAQWDELNSILKDKVYSRDINNLWNTDNSITDTVMKLPDDYIPLWKSSNSIYRKHALAYLYERGLCPSDILKYQIGYSTSGEYTNMIIIPSYDCNGKLNYFVGRSFYNSKFRYKLPTVSKNIIGFDNFINWDDYIVICEGVFDAIAIRKNAIPIYGKSIQSNLIDKILQKKPKRVYVALDEDAISNSLKLIELLMNNGISVYFVDIDAKDPSDMGFDMIDKLIKETLPMDFGMLMGYKLMNV